MNLRTLRHTCTPGRHLWLCLALTLGLALGARAAAARECHRETPLPADVRLVAPGPQVPEAVARFAGAWSGEWENTDGLCHTLVVEAMLVHGYAQVIFSSGTSVAMGVALPQFVRVTGRIVDGVLRFHLPEPDRPALAYRFADDTLSGTFKGAGHVRLTRVADVGQVGCGPQAGALPPAPPATGPRDRLTAAALLAPIEAGSGPVHNAYFLPIGQAAPALHAFRGSVTVATSTMFLARHGCAGLTQALPGFTVAFFTQGEHLVSVSRDLMYPPGIILSPGRVWSEPGDGGMSRASFPFMLLGAVGSRNGLATFLYDETHVSALRFQVVQENIPWRDKFDAWGQAPLTYTPGPLANEAALRAQFATELQQQIPIRPWSALPVAPGAPGMASFDGDTAPADLKASGLIVDGVLYLRGCETRWGPYPYCRQMRHAVFSMTKSLGAAIALLRLAQTYGDQVLALKIKDYVAVTAPHDGWERVTFADALNMATGIGDNAPRRTPNDITADEQKPKMSQWVDARTAKAKLDIAFSYGKYPWGPGEVLRYNSVHTFILAAAMDSFLKRQAGPQAHLWDMVVAEVFQPLGIFHLPTLHTQETDGGRGLPLLALGLYPTLDDVAKLTALLHHGGQHQGQQLLHAAKLAEALDTTDARGLPSRQENRFGEGRYHLSFWSVPYRTATGCFFQIPYMMGYGGNAAVLLPNGITALRFADGPNDDDVDPMVLAGEALRPFPCMAGAAQTPPPARPPLTASALHAEMPEHTFYRDSVNFFPGLFDAQLTMFVSADGVLYVTFKSGPDGATEHDVGTWHITTDGQFCWHIWSGRWKGCAIVHRDGETFTFSPQDHFVTEVSRRVPGNPEGY